MSALSFAAFVFIVTSLSAAAGFWVQKRIPEKLTDDATEGNVKVVFGMLSMLTSVVLGFVTAESKQNFDSVARIVTDNAARFVSLDRALAAFGEAAAPVREEIKESVETWIERINSPLGYVDADLGAVQRGKYYEEVVADIANLEPTNEVQTRAQARALDLASTLQHDRWVLTAERVAQTPAIFLYVVLAWLSVEFFMIGLFSTRNILVTIATLFGSIALASAMYLILELEGPTTGQLRVSTRALERCVHMMNH